jgi:hypothetical protein
MEQTRALTIDVPELEVLASEEGTRLKMKGFETVGDLGDPGLIRRVYRFVLPPNVERSSIHVEVESMKEKSVSLRNPLRPVLAHSEKDQKGDIRVQKRADGKKMVQGRNAEIFGVDRFFPESNVGSLGLSKFRSWNVLHIPVHPVRYNDSKGTLAVVEQLSLRIHFVQQGQAHVPFAQDSEIEALIQEEGLQVGVNLVRDFNVRADRVIPLDGLDYLIVTANAIDEDREENGLQDFVNHKQRLGYQVRVETVEDIESSYVSGDRASKIRSYIKTMYRVYGIRYVLLVGNPDPSAGDSGDTLSDESVVPMWVTSTGAGTVLSDMPYAELDEDWDLDGDGRISESWTETGYPDLMVGRLAPVGGYIDDIYESFSSRTEIVPREEKLRSVFEKWIRYDTELDKSWRYKMLGFASWMFGSGRENGAWSLDAAIREIESDHPDFYHYSVYQDATPWGVSDIFFDGVSDPEASAFLYGTGTFSVTGDALSTAYVSWTENGPYGIVGWVGHGSWSTVTVGGGSTRDGLALDRDWIYDPDGLAAGFGIQDEKPAVVYSSSCSNLSTGFGASSRVNQLQRWSNLAVSLQYRGAVCVVASTDLQWMGLGEDPVFGKAAWYQNEFLIGVADGRSFGRVFRAMKREVQSDPDATTAHTTEYRNHLLRTWNGLTLLGDPSQKLFLNTSLFADDVCDMGFGNDRISRATGLTSKPFGVLKGSRRYQVKDAVAKDDDWYVVRCLGVGKKSIEITLGYNQRLGELDVEILDGARNPIEVTRKSGESGITYTSTSDVVARVLYVRVAPQNHINEYDLDIRIKERGVR